MKKLMMFFDFDFALIVLLVIALAINKSVLATLIMAFLLCSVLIFRPGDFLSERFFPRKKIKVPNPTRSIGEILVAFLIDNVCAQTGWVPYATAENFDIEDHKVFILTLNQGNIIKAMYDSRHPTIISFVKGSGSFEILNDMILKRFGDGVVRLLPV